MIPGCTAEMVDDAEMTAAENRFLLGEDDIVFQYTEGDDEIFVSVNVNNSVAHVASQEVLIQTRWTLPDGASQQSEKLVTKSGAEFLYAMPMIGYGSYEVVVEDVVAENGAAGFAPGVTKTLLITNGDKSAAVKRTAVKRTVTQLITCEPGVAKYGNSNDNTMHGTGGNDALYGYEGTDALYGYECDDYLAGGKGRDTLYGDEGDDVLNGGAGNDTLYGGTGFDDCNGGDGIDTFFDCEIITQ